MLIVLAIFLFNEQPRLLR